MLSRSQILTNVFTQLREAGFVYNKSDFARHLSYDSTYMSSRFTGNREISDKTFCRILKVFPQVNKAYLFKGEGEVLNTGGPRNASQVSPASGTRDSYLDALLAERDTLLSRLDRLDKALAILCPCPIQSAS